MKMGTYDYSSEITILILKLFEGFWFFISSDIFALVGGLLLETNTEYIQDEKKDYSLC